jgi:hypothetical protein
MAGEVGRVAALWRAGPDERLTETRNYGRLRPIFDACDEVGVAVEPVIYRDELCASVRDRLVDLDGVLVWVDPIAVGEDRSTLDAMLRDVSTRGVWVSAHPDTIDKIGTKEVLYRTQDLGWGSDTYLYTNASEFHERFPERLTIGRPRVLKQNRGNGGIGVWKVARVAHEKDQGTQTPTADAIVRVQHAAPRDDVTEDIPLGAFMLRWDEYLSGDGKLIDQPYATRLTEGMVRVYVVRDEVVGFARQHPAISDTENVLGMPSGKTMLDGDEPSLVQLKSRLEREWIPGLRTLVELDEDELPILWDVDFLYGNPTDTDSDAYLLCEINASSVLPFPPSAPHRVALATRQRLTRRI